jgi:hypothetical protein
MHLVTSSLFLPGFIEHLKPTSQALLLRTYLSIALTVWVSIGRPKINIASFYKHTTTELSPPGPKPSPANETLTPESLYPNPWLPLLQSTILHKDEHFPKIQRALAHYAREYGDRVSGFWSGTELEGADLLDGTVFLRVAGLTMHHLGWMREGEQKKGWEYKAFWD